MLIYFNLTHIYAHMQTHVLRTDLGFKTRSLNFRSYTLPFLRSFFKSRNCLISIFIQSKWFRITCIYNNVSYFFVTSSSQILNGFFMGFNWKEPICTNSSLWKAFIVSWSYSWERSQRQMQIFHFAEEIIEIPKDGMIWLDPSFIFWDA